MLLSLHVKNLAIIEDEEVEFGKGMNVITGETGAGKSLLLGSVELVLGGRADRNLIRQGAEYALVEMAFSVDDDSILDSLRGEDIFAEEGVIVLSRRITEGRSNARINGETVSASLLSFAAGLLMDIHGQQDSRILLVRKNHLELLDEFGGESCRLEREKVLQLYHSYKTLLNELEEAASGSATREKDLALLTYEIQEIDSACIKKNEDEELEQLYKRLVHAQKITEAVGECGILISGDGGVKDTLDKAVGLLAHVAEYDESLDKLRNGFFEAEEVLSDYSRELGRYLDELDYSPELLAQTEERLNTINHLKDKYGAALDDILAAREERAGQLEKLTNLDDYLANKKAESESCCGKLIKAADELSSIRRKYAEKLEIEITSHLKELNFPNADFRIAFLKREQPGSSGYEDIEFMISMNPGEAVKPLADIASGGELSRIMLAVRTVLAGKDNVPTLIFDEIDAGISGRTAQLVAEKLHYIGEARQVLCITHLPQIAAMADHHFVIDKSVEDGRTHTHIREIADEASIEELSRMLGGSEITDTVRANAREMKTLAKAGSNHV